MALIDTDCARVNMGSVVRSKVQRNVPLAVVLIIHGIICLASALLPLYPLVLILYYLIHTSFAIKVIIVLVLGAGQVALGTYWLLENKSWRPRWYWFVIGALIIVGLILIFPSIHPPGLFNT